MINWNLDDPKLYDVARDNPPHNVRWIVGTGEGNKNELGVEIDGHAYFYYKHPGAMYVPDAQSRDVKPEDSYTYREATKREFGEVILSRLCA